MQIATYNKCLPTFSLNKFPSHKNFDQPPFHRLEEPSSSKILILSSSPLFNSYLLEHYKLQRCTYLFIPT